MGRFHGRAALKYRSDEGSDGGENTSRYWVLWLRSYVTRAGLGLCSGSDSVRSTKRPTAEYDTLRYYRRESSLHGCVCYGREMLRSLVFASRSQTFRNPRGTAARENRTDSGVLCRRYCAFAVCRSDDVCGSIKFCPTTKGT
jgi:hypothetical protein